MTHNTKGSDKAGDEVELREKIKQRCIGYISDVWLDETSTLEDLYGAADRCADEAMQRITEYHHQLIREIRGLMPKERKQDNVSGKDYHNGFNACLRELHAILDRLEKEKTG